MNSAVQKITRLFSRNRQPGAGIKKQFLDAVSHGDCAAVTAILDEFPDALTAGGAFGAAPLLHLAVLADSAPLIDLLLARGAILEAPLPLNGETPLMTAVRNNKEQAAMSLLDHGADPERPDKNGRTALLDDARQKGGDVAVGLTLPGRYKTIHAKKLQTEISQTCLDGMAAPVAVLKPVKFRSKPPA